MLKVSAGDVRLILDDVAASYGARPVLASISLELCAGEVLVVTGPNGSGKSTLLRLLCGLQRPDRGNIEYQVGGDSYGPMQAGPLIGWVAPDLALYRELTGTENLRFFAAVRGLPLAAGSVEALLTRVGLAGRGGDRVASYSTGMQQRLRYAYALLHHPPVLLLDEPTANLDERGAALVDRLIAEQRVGGITVVATNDQRELRWGNYVLTLGADAAAH
jgi:heme exporter protein A